MEKSKILKDKSRRWGSEGTRGWRNCPGPTRGHQKCLFSNTSSCNNEQMTCPTLDMCVLFQVLLSTRIVRLAIAVIW